MSVPPLNTSQSSVNDANANSSVWKRCPFLKLISSIWNTVKKIFNKIAESFTSPRYNLSKKDLEHLRAAKNRMHPTSPPSSPRTNSELRNRKVDVKKPVETNSTEELESLNDPVYREFREEAIGFINHALEATYEEKIAPVVPKIQKQIGNLDKYLKFGADVAISVGSGLSTPLVDKLKKFDIAEKLAPDLEQFMRWLLKGKEDVDQEQFYLQMSEKLSDITDSDMQGKIIEQCRKWLFETEQKDPFLQGSQTFIEKSALDQALKEAIVLLTEKRISEFNQKIKDKLNGHLPNIIENMLMNNGRKLGGIVIDRLIAVINQAPFSETFNEIVGLLADHSKAVVSAEQARNNAVKEEKSRLEKYDKAALDRVQKNQAWEADRQKLISLHEDNLDKVKNLWVEEAGKLAEQKASEEAKSHYQRLRKEEAESKARDEINQTYNDGDEVAIANLETMMRKKWLQNIGDQAARERYKAFKTRGEPICHPKIDELHLVREMNESKSSDILVKIIDVLTTMLKPEDTGDQHLFDKSAERLMKLLFPSVDVVDAKGKTHHVDGLIYLFDQIEYESELKDIYHEAVYIYREVVTPDNQKRIVDMIDSNKSFIEEHVLKYARNEIRSTVSESVAALFQKFIVPEKIDEMMALDLLPSTQETIVEALAKSVISDNISTYSPMFTRVVESSRDENKNEERKILITDVADLVKVHLKSFQIDDKRLNQLVENQINELEAILKDFLNDRDEQDLVNEPVIRSALSNVFKTQYHGSNASYGELVVNTAFKLGGMSSTAEFFAGWFKGTLARKISAATHEMQESPHYLLEKATCQIQKNFGTKEAVRDLIYSPSEIHLTQDIQERLDIEMKKTAKIAHDLLIYQFNQQSILVRKSIQWVVGSNPDHLESVIRSVYQKMFGDALYTQNLMVRIQEKISTALEKGASQSNMIKYDIEVV